MNLKDFALEVDAERKISFVVNLKDFALEVDAERTECALKMSVLISENVNMSLIHLASVAEEIGLCGFTKLRRS